MSLFIRVYLITSGARLCGRIGKLVKVRHVPNAVTVMVQANATGANREGAPIR